MVEWSTSVGIVSLDVCVELSRDRERVYVCVYGVILL